MSYIKSLLLFVTVTVYNIAVALCSLQCLDENGKPVDWFVVYKLPEIFPESSSLVKNGSAYLFITSESTTGEWNMSEILISSEDSLVARTLYPFYHSNIDDIWLTYNDQSGNKSGESYGHTKGVVGANKNGGFWLIHSVPHFPPLSKEYSYPETGYRFGQSMLCISFPQEQVDKLGIVFMYNKPKILKMRISKSLETLYPNLVLAAKGTTIKKAPWYMSTNISSVNGRMFTNFAKTKKFEKDLYAWVADEFKTNIYAETWQNEVDPLPSKCDFFEVKNIESITFKKESKADVTFSSHKDHSKWAVSESVSKPWVCIGDINRALPQEKRGGGTMCLEDKRLWKSYHSLIGESSQCRKHKYKYSINHITI